MWRLQKSPDGDSFVLALSGRLESEHVSELRSIFADESKHGQFALDLTEIKLVDEDVVAFFAICEVDGIRLLNCPAYIQEWIRRNRSVWDRPTFR